jgi:arylsulfatase A
MPTISDIIQTKTPDNIDGISFLPTLEAKGNQKKHDYLYWEFLEMNGKQAIRQGDWKAVKLNVMSKSKTVTELYNLKDDPSETENMAQKYPEKVKEMQVLMDKGHTESQLFPFYSKIK